MSLASATVRAAAPGSADGSALVDRLRGMDAEAWECLYRDHHAAIYRYALYRVRDRELAEDLAAEVFVQAVRSIGRYRDRGRPLLAWLYGIARNLVADHSRRRGRRGAAGHVAATPGRDETVPDPADDLADRRALLDAMAILSDDQQTVVILRFFEDRSLADTATLMGRSTGTIKALQHRAIARLRALLATEDLA